jgi:hypothetical protein
MPPAASSAKPNLRALAVVLLVAACAGGGSGKPAPSDPEPDPGPVLADAAASTPSAPKPSGTGGGGAPDAAAGPVREPPDAAAPAPTADGGGPAQPPPGPTTGRTIVVSAGQLDRENTPVSFTLPGAAAGHVYALRDAQGGRVPVQVGDAGRATFILPALKAGAEASFVLEESSGTAEAAVKAVKEPDGVKLTLGASTVFRYQLQGKLPGGVGQNYLRGGYIHPLYTPGGLVVTDDYPGDHRHHHGIWSAWAHTVFEGRSMDFWNMGGGSAKVDFESLAGTWEGPVHAGLRTNHVHVDLRAPGQPKVAIKEQWVVTVYKTQDGPAPYFLFDIDSTQEAATASPVMLQTYLYGGFAFRGSAQWQSGANFLTSEGKNRGSGDGSTGRWCHMGGNVGGKPGGYAVLGHPDNFRAPQPMRINPTDPYWTFAPVKMGGFPLVMGKPYVTRFRLVASDGPADKALLDRLWNDFATPPAVTVKAAP